MKEFIITVRNTSAVHFVVDLAFDENSTANMLFSCSTRSLRMQSMETRSVLVYFHPTERGHNKGQMTLTLPGEDFVKVDLHGQCGSPLLLQPEGEDASCLGPEELSRVRSELMKPKIAGKGHESHALNDPNLMRTLLNSDGERALILDFGMCFDAGTFFASLPC